VDGLLFDTVATAAATVTSGATTGGTSLDSMDQFMSGFMVLVGLFAIYSAVTGKGPAFKNDYPVAMQAEANKMMRTFCWIIGPVVTIFSILEYMKNDWGTSWAYWVNLGITVPAIIVYVVLFRRKFKKYLKR
jgi:cytochrome bd-type quinol oxidase subunit 2